MKCEGKTCGVPLRPAHTIYISHYFQKKKGYRSKPKTYTYCNECALGCGYCEKCNISPRYCDVWFYDCFSEMSNHCASCGIERFTTELYLNANAKVASD